MLDSLRGECSLLGPLIFGALWPSLICQAGIKWDGALGSDALSQYFSKGNASIVFSSPFILTLSIAYQSCQHTWLDCTMYDELFVSNTRATWHTSYCYRWNHTDIWSIIPAFPENSADNLGGSGW